MGRKTVPLKITMSDSKPLNNGVLIKMLDEYMPRDPNPEWVGLVGEFFEELITKLQVTANASAGAPYWRNKGECMDQIIDVGLPKVIEALKTPGGLGKLWKENPEFFLVEVKNKLDRYEISKLEEKTRPYVSTPAHWAFLFSMLTQGFQETLHVFDKNPASSNAYGFSSSNGGLKRMVQWMYGADKRGKVVCYGDDACIVVRRGKRIYRIDPDFKQMDGSLDAEDINLTIEWIQSHVQRDLGRVPPFWKSVCGVWKKMAVDPYFLVDGTAVYKKKSPNGLMTGIPGTTLFDTVKSVMAWNKLLDVCDRGEGDILDQAFVTKWMATQGLVVKAGTWNPAPLPEEHHPGELVTDHKFLGVQILCVNYKNTLQFVPTIPEDEAIQMLVCQKDNPFKKSVSRTSQARTLYDRMRGLMITFGFTHKIVTDAIHNVVNNLPAEIILMQVQNGTGERPEHITMQEFDYPDSSGFPSEEFCISVYADVEEKPGWIDLFPGLHERLNEFKSEIRKMNKRYRLLLTPEFAGIKAEMVEEKTRDIPEAYRVVEAKQEVAQPTYEQPNPRSRIEQTGDLPPVKIQPTLGQSIKAFLEGVGGITQVATVCDRFSIHGSLVEREASNWGFYLTGIGGWDLVSLNPIATPFETKQEAVFDKLQEKRSVVNKSTAARMEGLKASERLVYTAPEMVMINMDFFVGLFVPVRRVDDDVEARVLLNKMLAQNGMTMTWRSRVDPTRENPVCAELLIKTEGSAYQIGAVAWSLSKNLAQGYIARAILEANFVEVEKSKFSVQHSEIQRGNWADEVEAQQNPKAAPQVVNISQAPVKDYIVERVEKELPYVPQYFVNIAYSLVSGYEGFKEFSDEEVVLKMRALLLKADTVHGWSSDSSSSGAGMAPHNMPSKRSKLSPAQRTNRNRKTLEKRKAKRRSKSLPVSP
uniref:RdRp n=1 Tax=Viola philippica permutotetra like virus TaxID=2739863 RepID=A0A6M9BMG5_9VIRU|nr:hypothetical protein 1 [Viola philippica permutotetra like virus]